MGKNQFTAYYLPTIVIEGFNFPSKLNKGLLSIFANGLFGLGSFGVPSTRVQDPILASFPILGTWNIYMKIICGIMALNS